VFANGMEVSAKKSDNQSIAAMPDICLSPPSPPAGPIPIPYPNFSQASDTSDGTKAVKLGGQEAGIKNESNYKTSKGDEAATRTLGMGTVTHTIQGKTKFAAWSMDVKFEGSNVPRFGDITTHNHMNPANSGSQTASIASPDAGVPPKTDCEELEDENSDARTELKNKTKDKTLVGTDGKGRGTTVSSAKITSSSVGSGFKTAHSRGKAHEKLPARFEKGGDPADRAAGKSNLCAGSGHSHPSPAMQKSGHAEARIFDGMGPTTGGSVTLSIDWKPKSKKSTSKMPCEDCHKMLCAAEDNCKIEIKLCDKKGKPQKLAGHCPADQSSYQRLQATMGEI